MNAYTDLGVYSYFVLFYIHVDVHAEEYYASSSIAINHLSYAG